MENEGKRLNKYISDAGICSRREADRLIAEGRVEIRRKSRKDEPLNPRLRAEAGERVFHGDTVYIDGRDLPKKETDKVYYAYHKPRGVICTADRSVEGNVIDAAGLPQRVSYAGRLDKDSSGLLIMTNDGDLINRMMRASSFHEKEYRCVIDRPVTEEFIAAMAGGVKILLDDDEHLRKNPRGVFVTTRPCRVRQTGIRSFSIVLTQGLNRQIRRMCRALGCSVVSLQRTRILDLRLGDLGEGSARKLTPDEIAGLQRAAAERPREERPSRTGQTAAGDRQTGGGKTGSGKSFPRTRAGSGGKGSLRTQMGSGGKSRFGSAKRNSGRNRPRQSGRGRQGQS